MQHKDRLIAAIQEHNPTAGCEFLIEFNEQALRHYLEHLHHTLRPRQERRLWIRQPETPAVVTRLAAAR